MRILTITLIVAALAALGLGVTGFASGRLATYRLYTHCGIRDAEFGGKHYYADPPLGDGVGNPPAGWGNPTDDGFIVVRDADTVYFFDLIAHHATFTAHPRSGVPKLPLCS